MWETINDYRGRLEAIAEKAAREHTERMAALPPGTCETCYGSRVVDRGYRDGGLRPCADCTPPSPPPWVCAIGVPMEFRTASFENYRLADATHRAAVDKVRTFASDGRDLFLIGGVGTGKTRLACTIANECMNARPRVGAMFARVLTVLNRLQPGRSSAESAGELEQSLFSTSLLVVDDVGAEQNTDFARRTLLLIAEERFDRGLRTIWTSNLSLHQLSDLQGDDRLTSRLAGRADIVRLAGPDQRNERGNHNG